MKIPFQSSQNLNDESNLDYRSLVYVLDYSTDVRPYETVDHWKSLGRHSPRTRSFNLVIERDPNVIPNGVTHQRNDTGAPPFLPVTDLSSGESQIDLTRDDGRGPVQTSQLYDKPLTDEFRTHLTVVLPLFSFVPTRPSPFYHCLCV